MNERILITFALVFSGSSLVLGLLYHPIGTLIGAAAGLAIALACQVRRMSSKNMARLAIALGGIGVGFQLLATPGRMAVGLAIALAVAHAAGWLGDDV